ncbi:MAG: signal peptidase I [Patescibacteria group bacterium]
MWRIIYGGGILFDLTKWLILVVVVFLLVNTFFISIFVVDGWSMDPNLVDKEVILWNKNAYTKANPERGDVVVVNYPGNIKKQYVKRVVGLPGETIEVAEGSVYIDGQKFNESYLTSEVITDPNFAIALKNDQYFVMGDNRTNSSDSRAFGPVAKRFVLGKSLKVIYPSFKAIPR